MDTTQIADHLETLLTKYPAYNEAIHFYPNLAPGARQMVCVIRSSGGVIREIDHCAEGPGRSVPQQHTTIVRGPRWLPEISMTEKLTAD
jgi:hypothetical protein